MSMNEADLTAPGSQHWAVLINYTQLTVRPMAPWGPFTDEFNDAASPALRTLLALDYGESLRRRLPTANGK